MLTVTFKLFVLSVIYADCHKQALSVECHYDDYRYAECRYTECRYAECGGVDEMAKRPT
jgi:hypothetical protein